MQVLVSGASSGLGRYLAEIFSADAYDRRALKAPKASYDAIIHTAFNTSRGVPSDAFGRYIADTVGTTEKLLEIPHAKFIFISSVDVYPSAETPYREDTVFDTDQIGTMYGRMKLVCEQLVANRQPAHLILRPTAMLGPYIRPNSLMRLLYDDRPKLTLHPESRFNYVLHSDIGDLIRICIERDTTGILNVAAADTVTLQQVTETYKRSAIFGAFRYNATAVDNARAAALQSGFARTSLANIDLWMSSFHPTA